MEREECNLEFFKAIERRIVESSRSRHLLTHRRGKILANIWLSREIFKLLVLSVPIAVVPGKECVQYLGRYLSQRKDFSPTVFFFLGKYASRVYFLYLQPKFTPIKCAVYHKEDANFEKTFFCRTLKTNERGRGRNKGGSGKRGRS